VGTFLKTAVALLVIVSVATVLVTPDNRDDVDGLLRQHVLLAQPAFHALLHIVSRLSLGICCHDLALHRLECLNLLDLVCVRLC